MANFLQDIPNHYDASSYQVCLQNIKQFRRYLLDKARHTDTQGDSSNPRNMKFNICLVILWILKKTLLHKHHEVDERQSMRKLWLLLLFTHKNISHRLVSVLTSSSHAGNSLAHRDTAWCRHADGHVQHIVLWPHFDQVPTCIQLGITSTEVICTQVLGTVWNTARAYSPQKAQPHRSSMAFMIQAAHINAGSHSCKCSVNFHSKHCGEDEEKSLTFVFWDLLSLWKWS